MLLVCSMTALAQAPGQPAAAAVARSTDAAPPATATGEPSRITGVIVYPGWARVTRTVSPRPGQTFAAVELTDLPPWLALDSLSATATGATVLDVHGRLEREDLAQKIESAEEALADLQAAVATGKGELEERRHVLGVERENLQKLMTWKLSAVAEEQSARTLTVEELAAVAKLNEAVQANAEARLALDAEERKLSASLTAATEALAELREQQPEEQAVLTIELQRQTTAKTVTVDVSYTVPGASWYPSYQVRDTGGATVELVRSALVRQITGEDWQQARIAVAVAAEPPAGLDALFDRLHTSVAANDKEQHRAHAIFARHLQRGQSLLRQAAVLGVTSRSAFAESANAPSGGALIRGLIGAVEMPVARRYRLRPAQSDAAVLTATLTHTGSSALLPGPVTVLGAAATTAQLPAVLPGTEVEIALGESADVRVERLLAPGASATSDIGKSGQLDLTYRLTVRNTTGRVVAVQLDEHLPAEGVQLLTAAPLASRRGNTLSWQLAVGAGEAVTASYMVRWRYAKENPPALANALATRLSQGRP
jgi:hypothetical protein